MNQARSHHFFLRWQRQKTTGFTLVEMAVVVTLMAIFLTMGLRLLQASKESSAWSETRLKQERIKVALISFLRANGRLPCPNTAAPWDGAEDSPCLVNAGRGIVPWQALGLSLGDVQDGWSNFFSYRVANRTPASSSNWTLNTGATAFTLAELITPLTTFTLQQRDAAGVLGPALTPNPVLMLISHGKNGSGARTIRGSLNAAPAAANVDELANSTLTSTTFVSRAANDVAAATGGIFDDVIAYMTPRDLLQPLVDDKTLKGGTTAYYRELAMQQVALISCTPPLLAPSLLNVQPSVGNSAITYTCPAGAYLCRTAIPMSNVSTAGGQALYQLSMFGLAAADVTYSQLLAAFPGVSARCP